MYVIFLNLVTISRFSRELAQLFYAEHKSEPFFEDLIDYITSGPVIGMVLARKDGIAHWRRVLGPTKVSEASKKVPNSIRAIFGDPKSDKRNACHGSDSPSSAEREIEIIFPHIFQEESHRPGTAESAMVNGHTVPIRSPRTVFEVHWYHTCYTYIFIKKNPAYPNLILGISRVS